jgi:hypothetical protein
MRLVACFLTASTVLLFSGPAAAETALPWWDAPGPDAAWTGFTARFGTGWSVLRDGVAGSPSLIVGPGHPLGAPITADDAGVARARALLEELRGVLGVDDPAAFALERAVAVPGPHGHEIVTIVFAQRTGDGLEVWHESEGGAREHRAAVRFLFDGTMGRLVALGSDAVPALATPEANAMSESDAVGAALAHLALAAAEVREVRARTYVSVRDGRARRVREARVFPAAGPRAWRVLFDAATGLMLETRDEARSADVIGTVQAGRWDYPGGSFGVAPQAGLRVAVLGGSFATTNSLGRFTIPHQGTAPVTIVGGFLGDWAVVSDASGNGNLSFSQGATPGILTTVTLNPSSVSELEDAEAAGYAWTTATRFFIQQAIPSFTGLATLPVEVNSASGTCNAYWVGTGLRFLRSGGGCRNSAYRDVVTHEYGHAFHDWFHGSASPAGFSEGIGDHLSLYSTRQRVVGRNFRLDGSAVRDYGAGRPESLRQWPGNDCGGASHCVGQVWAGFTMDLADALVAADPVSGWTTARTITVGPYASDPSHEAMAAVLVLVYDDNDGNLSNGTPHCAAIVEAARRHSLPVPFSVPLSCGADPMPWVPEWRAPAVETRLNTASDETSPVLSADGLTIWFTSNRPGGAGGYDVWTATRTAQHSPWGAPALVPGISSASNEFSISVTADALTMFLATDRPGGLGLRDLWVSNRNCASCSWGPPVPVPELSSVSSEEHPAVSADGLEIVFTSQRTGSVGLLALWSSTRTSRGAPWSTPARLAELDSSAFDYAPALSADGRWLIYSSNRAGGSGGSDLYVAHRTFRGEAWTPWRRITELATAEWEYTPSLGGGDFSIVFSRGGTGDLWRAERLLPILSGPAWGRPGTVVQFRLRRDPIDVGQIWLGLDPLPPAFVSGFYGWLQIVPAVRVGHDIHNDQGMLPSIPIPVPATPGLRVWLQGVSQGSGGYYLSNRVSFLVVP